MMYNHSLNVCNNTYKKEEINGHVEVEARVDEAGVVR